MCDCLILTNTMSSNLHKSLMQKRTSSIPPRPTKPSSQNTSSDSHQHRAFPKPATMPKSQDTESETSSHSPSWSDYYDERGFIEGKWRYYVSYAGRDSRKQHGDEHQVQQTHSDSSSTTPSPQSTESHSGNISSINTNVTALPRSTSHIPMRPRNHILVLIHGGGLTALSFASFVKSFRFIHPCASVSQCTEIFAMDLRDHGESFDSDELSMEDFTNDVVHVLQSYYKDKWNESAFVLCGHSLGGAIAVHAAHKLQQKCTGIIVLDVVEGTAIQALPFMKQMIANRPQKFRNLSDAIAWSLNNVTQSTESAAISFPSQLKKQSNGYYTWRTDLEKSAKYWHEWYDQLSTSFLQVPAPKLLILANKDRLDKELTIGEMQGKFQLKVVYASGHYVHEDNPAQCAASVAQFMHRFLRIG